MSDDGDKIIPMPKDPNTIEVHHVHKATLLDKCMLGVLVLFLIVMVSCLVQLRKGAK